jgi:hypothetical protein
VPELVSYGLDVGTPRHADMVFNCRDEEDLDRLLKLLQRDRPLLLQGPEGTHIYLLPVRHSVDPGDSFPRRVRLVLVESEAP